MSIFRLGFRQGIKSASLVKSVKLSNQQLGRFSSQVGTKEYFDEVVSKKKVVIFMKGTPDEPRCGFSNAVVQVLRMHGVQYDAYNVLDDENIRQGIKEYSDWPTIPQVFVNGDFIGGCDILIQMHQNGELIDELKKVGIKSVLLQAAEDKDKGKE